MSNNMTTKEFVEKAMEGGYEPNKLNQKFEWEEDGVVDNFQIDVRHVVLDPEAWEAVGEVEGWGDEYMDSIGGGVSHTIPRWIEEMHQMVDYLVEGKTIEEFLETL